MAAARRALSRKTSGPVYERALLRAQQEASPNGILVVDPQGRILSHNRRFGELWGIPAAVLASKEDDRAIAFVLDKVADPEGFRKGIDAIYRQPELSSDDEIRLKDGRVFQRQSAPVVGDDGERYGRVWYFRDITQQKRAEEAAEETRRTHESYVLAVAGSSDGLWDWNLQTDEVYFSPRYKEMLGYAPEELPNRFETWIDLIHPEDKQRALDKVRAYHDGRIPVYELEHRLRHKDGRYRWILARGTVLRDATGRLVRMSGSHTDIHTRKVAEEALRESELRFRQLSENIREAFWLVGAPESRPEDTEIVYMSPMWAQIWGRPLPPLDSITRVWMDSLHPEDRERVLAQGSRGKEGYEHQYRILRPDGQVRWVRDRAFPVKGSDGRVVRIAGVSEDITERRRLEEDLRAARDEALASANAKSEFLANVSHELRTPLNAVIGMNELMLDGALDDVQRERAAVARDAGRGLLALIDDLLDFARLGAGRLALDHAPFDPRELVTGVERMFAHKAAEKGLALSARVDPGVPAALIGDAARLRQVLVNFVGNALKFTELGAITLEADCRPAGQDVLLRLRVRDTGPGIPPQTRARLFVAFTQGDASATKRHGGAGLGLAISRQLAELMGGTVGVESEPGAGSLFYFEAPLRPAPAAPQPAPAACRADVRGLRVLVVEDNAVNRRVTLQQLQQLGCSAETAEDGAGALQRLAAETFDAVLMDCAMPVMDGYAAAAELRRREGAGKRVPVIALTAGARPEDRARCLAAGMDAHLAKPVSLDALAAALSRWGGPLDADALARASAAVGADAARWRAEYLADARRLVTDIGRCAAAGDADGLKRAAHTLKGASAALGARRLAALCARIEAGLPPRQAELERELALVGERLAP